MRRRRHAEIGGAGLAGLTLATALAHRGWSVRVHERAPHLRDIGVGTSIWENGHRALHEVGALEEVESYGTRILRAELIDHRLRALRVQFFNDTDDRALVVLRVDHHRALVNAARKAGVDIVTGSPVKGAAPAGKLILESGECVSADLVAGCDGINSRIRESLGLGEETGYVTEAWTGRTTVPRESRPEFEINQNFWSGHRRCGILSCGDVNYIYFCAPEHCPHNAEERKSRFLDKAVWTQAFPHLEDNFRRVDAGVIWNRYSNIRCRAWSAGRAAIVGDSAHGMPPLLAQGSGCAMANAVALAESVTDDVDIPSALQAWEKRERPVTDITQRWAVLSLVMSKRWPLNLIDMRSELMADAYASPALMDHYFSAARHIVKVQPRIPDIASSVASDHGIG
jgi:2-polyprenyl-6-methoxyphenol hydroxylase-like FAD-dependent oxidoreductase